MNALSPQRAADRLVATLQERIVSGTLPDGSMLPSERHLMEEFSMSRTVVREAVQTLSTRGLVDAPPRFRPKVRAPGVNTAIDALGSIVAHMLAQDGGVRNLFETRIMIEAALVREAAEKATKSDLAELRDALDANGAAVEDSALFYETDVVFHGLLYEVPRNPIMTSLHHAYTAWLSPHWSRMPQLPDRNIRNHADHRAIFEAILMRDPGAAEMALRLHLDNAWDQINTTLEDPK